MTEYSVICTGPDGNSWTVHDTDFYQEAHSKRDELAEMFKFNTYTVRVNRAEKADPTAPSAPTGLTDEQADIDARPIVTGDFVRIKQSGAVYKVHSVMSNGRLLLGNGTINIGPEHVDLHTPATQVETPMAADPHNYVAWLREFINEGDVMGFERSASKGQVNRLIGIIDAQAADNTRLREALATAQRENTELRRGEISRHFCEVEGCGHVATRSDLGSYYCDDHSAGYRIVSQEHAEHETNKAWKRMDAAPVTGDSDVPTTFKVGDVVRHTGPDYNRNDDKIGTIAEFRNNNGHSDFEHASFAMVKLNDGSNGYRGWMLYAIEHVADNPQPPAVPPEPTKAVPTLTPGMHTLLAHTKRRQDTAKPLSPFELVRGEKRVLNRAIQEKLIERIKVNNQTGLGLTDLGEAALTAKGSR